MDVITCSSDPYSPVNIARRNYRLAKVNWGLANKGRKDKSEAAKNMNKARNAMRELLYGQSETYVPHLETTIYGIPCGIVVTHYSPGREWRQHTFPGAGPGDCDPPEPADCEWFVVDRRGYRADWLQEKMDWSDIHRIDRELGV